MLAINTNSFHYRYYSWIRYMWGFDDTPERTSLCPYVQTMLWGSIFCVLFSWALVLGWVVMKLGRIACKLENPVTDYIVNELACRTQWMEDFDRGPSQFSESPILTGLMFTFFGVTSLITIALALSVIGAALATLGLGVWHIGDVLSALFYGGTWGFSKIFMEIFYWFGFIFHQTYVGVIWLFTNGPLWYSIGSWAVYILAWVLATGVVAILLCLLFINVAKLPFTKRFGGFLTNKFNGFSEAQEARKTRIREAVMKSPPWECKYCNYKSNVPNSSYCNECDERRPKPMPKWQYLLFPFIPLLWAFNQLFLFGDKVKDREIDIIGPFVILWSYIVALKKGVCPLVEFVDSEEVQAQARSSAKARMEREEAENTMTPHNNEDPSHDLGGEG